MGLFDDEPVTGISTPAPTIEPKQPAGLFDEEPRDDTPQQSARQPERPQEGGGLFGEDLGEQHTVNPPASTAGLGLLSDEAKVRAKENFNRSREAARESSQRAAKAVAGKAQEVWPKVVAWWQAESAKGISKTTKRICLAIIVATVLVNGGIYYWGHHTIAPPSVHTLPPIKVESFKPAVTVTPGPIHVDRSTALTTPAHTVSVARARAHAKAIASKRHTKSRWEREQEARLQKFFKRGKKP